mgnify:CR=1 FL=1
MDSLNKDLLAELGAEPAQDDFSDLGAEPIEATPQPGLGEQVTGAVKNALPNAIPITKQIGKRIFSNAEAVGNNPMLQSLDPASKAGFVLQNTMQGVFDEGGELTATRLAQAGVNPYMAAVAGSVVQYIPDIAFSLEGLAAIRAAGNARAESEILGRLMKKNNPMALEYKPRLPIEAPTTVVESGPAIPLESNSTKLLKGSKPLALPDKTAKGEGFIMSEKPDTAKLQQMDAMSGQPKYPEDMGSAKTMRGYAGRKRLSADVPEFNKVETSVAPADRYNPAVSELVDESRRQYVGVDPRLEVVKDMETGRTTFRLKQDPELGKRVVTEAEHASNTATKNSAAVKEMGLDERIVDSSPMLPGSETIPVLKEGVVAGSRSFVQNFWNRIGVAAEDAISRMGDAGKQMANGIRTVRDVPQVRYGEFSAEFDKYLKGMSKHKARAVSELLADTLEGRESKVLNVKLPEGMLEFVQQKLKVIADEAAAIGLQVRNSSGEVVPFAARENYFPRVLRQEIFDGLISGDDKVMRDIAQKMVNNKQQPNFQMAFERVKYMRNKMMSNKYGHLERAREVELSPELYDRNSLRVIPEYINSALHRIEEVRQFGLEGERALEMLSNMQQQGHDAKLARTIFERFTRIEPRDNVYLRGAQGLRNVTAGMLIQAQSTVLQLGQAMMPAYEAGVFNAIKGFAKSFTELGATEAKRAGQVFNIAAEEYMKEAYGSGSYGFGSKFVDGVFKMTGFTRMDHFLRKYAALTGKEYIPSLVKKLVNNPASKTARVELQNLGYDTGKILRNKGISVEELNVGAKRFADMTQGAPDVTRLPEFWTRPEGKLFGQFKNFSYLIGKQNVSMIKRALQTGNVARLGEMAVGLPMTGYVISELRKAMVGESQYEITGNEEVDQVIEILGNATAFGPSMDLFFQALQGPQNLKNFILPTSVSNILEITGQAGKALKTGETEDLQKTLLKKTPVVGKVLANQVYGE